MSWHMNQAHNVELSGRVSDPNLVGNIDGKTDLSDGKQIPVVGENSGIFEVEVYTPPSDMKLLLGAVLHPLRTIRDMFWLVEYNMSDERYGPLYKKKEPPIS